MSHLTNSSEWQALKAHQQDVNPLHIRDLFAADPSRFNSYSILFDDLLFDYSKNRITSNHLVL